MHQIINTRCDVFVVAVKMNLLQNQGGNESVKFQSSSGVFKIIHLSFPYKCIAF